MKKDKLLQHQLERLDVIIEARNKRTGFNLPGDKQWFDRSCDIYQGAIRRSIQRYRIMCYKAIV
jgi:hypothetical protein